LGGLNDDTGKYGGLGENRYILTHRGDVKRGSSIN